MTHHKHKVEDTKLRSALKALSGNGLEVVVDTLLFASILSILGVSSPVPISFALSVATEILCFITNYFNDRAWNRIQWGRVVVDVIEKHVTNKEK